MRTGSYADALPHPAGGASPGVVFVTLIHAGCGKMMPIDGLTPGATLGAGRVGIAAEVDPVGPARPVAAETVADCRTMKAHTATRTNPAA